MTTTPHSLLAVLAMTLVGTIGVTDADAQDAQAAMTLERIGAVHMMRPEELPRYRAAARAQLAATAPTPTRATSH